MCHSPCGDIGRLSQLASPFSVYLHECFSVHVQILMKDGVCIGADFPQQQSGMCAENPTVSLFCVIVVERSAIRIEKRGSDEISVAAQLKFHLIYF